MFNWRVLHFRSVRSKDVKSNLNLFESDTNPWSFCARPSAFLFTHILKYTNVANVNKPKEFSDLLNVDYSPTCNMFIIVIMCIGLCSPSVECNRETPIHITTLSKLKERYAVTKKKPSVECLNACLSECGSAQWTIAGMTHWPSWTQRATRFSPLSLASHRRRKRRTSRYNTACVFVHVERKTYSLFFLPLYSFYWYFHVNLLFYYWCCIFFFCCFTCSAIYGVTVQGFF